MPYKKRSYYKHEEAKARDYSLFVIACEGTKTEPVIHVFLSLITYINIFKNKSVALICHAFVTI